MSKIIIGFVGNLSSGKGTAAAYLQEKHQARVLSFSRILRDILDRIYIPQTRDNLIRMSEIVRAEFGDDLLSKVIAQDAEQSEQALVVVDGIRRLPDIDQLKNKDGFVLVEVFADPKIRYERLTARTENQDDQSKTYEQFMADHKRSTEVSILEVAKQATERIDNNGDLPSLYKQIDQLVLKLTKVSS